MFLRQVCFNEVPCRERCQKGGHGTVGVARLRRSCTSRPGMRKIYELLGSGSIHRLCYKNLCTSTTSLFSSMLIRQTAYPLIFVLNSVRRTNCFCRSLARVLKARRMLFFPSSFHHTVGCKRGSTTGRVLHARILDHLRGKRRKLYIIACPSTLTRGIISHGRLKRGALGLRTNREISVGFIASMLHDCNFRCISCICRPKRCTIHNDVVSIFSFSSRCPFHVSFFNSRIRDIHAFRIRARLSGRGGRDVIVIPSLDRDLRGGKDNNVISFLSFLPSSDLLTVHSFL